MRIYQLNQTAQSETNLWVETHSNSFGDQILYLKCRSRSSPEPKIVTTESFPETQWLTNHADIMSWGWIMAKKYILKKET